MDINLLILGKSDGMEVFVARQPILNIHEQIVG